MAKRARAAVCVRAHTTELDKFAALLAAADAAAGELPDPLLLPSPCALRFCPRLADALSAIFLVRRHAEGTGTRRCSKAIGPKVTGEGNRGCYM